MEKVVYLLSGLPDAGAGDALRDVLLGEVTPALLGMGVAALTVNVHDSAAAEAPSPAPAPEDELTHVALVSVWLPNYQRRGPIDSEFAAAGLPVDSYLVLESLVDDYGETPYAGPRGWPDGERSPGVSTVALIHRPAEMDEATWLYNWHEVQSPASGRLQPRTRYVRNHVSRGLSPGAPQVDGIVEEAWPSVEHVRDPMLFFNAGGDDAVLAANVKEMMENVEACLDLGRLRSTTMSEYLIRTLQPELSPFV